MSKSVVEAACSRAMGPAPARASRRSVIHRRLWRLALGLRRFPIRRYAQEIPGTDDLGRRIRGWQRARGSDA